jgi:hypothetical protein
MDTSLSLSIRGLPAVFGSVDGDGTLLELGIAGPPVAGKVYVLTGVDVSFGGALPNVVDAFIHISGGAEVRFFNQKDETGLTNYYVGQWRGEMPWVAGEAVTIGCESVAPTSMAIRAWGYTVPVIAGYSAGTP